MRYLFFLAICFTAHAQNNNNDPVPVTVKSLNEVLIERQLSANANVQAINNSQLSAEITAVAQTIHVDVGDVVEQDQLLISLDATDLRLQLDQAKANTAAAQARLKQAELRLQRAEELQQSQYISADDFLARQTDVSVLRADLLRLQVAQRAADREVDKTQITAPFDGVITSRQVQQGQLLTTGAPLLTLVQQTGAQIHAKIPSHTAQDLQVADRIEFVSQQQVTPVELIQLSPVIESQTALQTARLKPLGPVLVGQTGQLKWYLKGRMMPADLIVKRQGQLGLFVVAQDTAKFVPIEGAQEGRPAELKTADNWQVIIGGRERLQDGQAIRIK